MTYDSPTTINATKGLGEILIYVNNVTNQWVSNLALLGVFIIILMGYYKAKDDFVGAFAVSGFGTFIAGLLFWMGGFVSGWAFAISIAVMFIGVIVILVDKNG